MVDVLIRDEPVNGEVLVRRLGSLPFWVVGALVVLHAGALTLNHVLGIADHQPWRFLQYQFNLNRELNVATWAATLLLASAGALLLTISMEAHCAGNESRRHRWRHHWAALGVIFLLLSLDEMCSFHERLSEPVQRTLDVSGGLLTNAWVVVALPLLAAVVVPFLPFLWSLPRATRWRFVAAGTIFVSGAAGVELVSGLARDRYGFDDPRFAGTAAVEEFLELVGVAVFLRSLVGYMFHNGTLFHLVHGRGSTA